MTVRVLYFAAARDAAGTASESLDLAGRSVAEVTRALAERHPGLARVLARSRVALDQRFVDAGALVPDGAELAIIPPVAGG